MPSSSEELTDEESEVVHVVARQRTSDTSDSEDMDDEQEGDEIEDEGDEERAGDPINAVSEENDSVEQNDDFSDADGDVENDGDGEIIEAVVVQEDADEDDSDGENTVEVSVIEERKVSTKSKRKVASPSTPSKRMKKNQNGQKKAASKSEAVVSDSRNRRKAKKKEFYDPSDSNEKTTTIREGITSSLDPVKALYGTVHTAVIQVANDARTMLRDSVPVLPFPVADTQVNAWGRLCIQIGGDEDGSEKNNGDDSKANRKFNTKNALYPIGFICDRWEFSPVHGRILKMRCSILDGKSIKSRQTEIALTNEISSTNTNASAMLASMETFHDGPIFRISWGPGVDDETDRESEHPYDPDIHSQPIFINAKGKRRNDFSSSMAIPPEKGMRVKVRLNEDQFCLGNIETVTFSSIKDSTNKKSKASMAEDAMVSVKYDHGSVETLNYPDPDLVVILPGMDDEVGPNGEVELTEINGKAVTSVVGESPLEAWGKALCRLGMIDEYMLNNGFKSLEKSRRDAREKIGAKSKPRSSTTGQERKEYQSEMQSPNTTAGGDERGPSVGREDALRKRVEDLLVELEEAKTEDRKSQVLLGNARIQDLGPFMCNPFYEVDTTKPQQLSWLAIAVRREKTRMGSTGNKKKIVTTFDLLERNNTFYNADIESLIEGLPGSELCRPYVFQAFRGGTTPVNRSWLQDAQTRNDAETVKEKEKERDIERSERSKKAHQRARELQAIKDEQEVERENKKRKRDELRDERKMQKQVEEDEKKKARVDERMSRLEIQINERLYKDAAFQREKVVLVMARSVSKEFSRRRRAAELVAVQSMVDVKQKTTAASKPIEQIPLPMIAKVYDEDTVRVWDFISTFKSYFLQRGYMQQIPSLQSLQDAVTCIKEGPTPNPERHDDAVSFLTDLAVALCKPLAASLTRILFASLIALNPSLQKEFGATFFNEVNAANTAADDIVDNPGHPDVILPVNAMTWQEIARLAFLSDALSEMGYSRQEAAHLLRGYRSAGHPNSKESKRLRKAEDVAIAILRQKVSERRAKDDDDLFSRNRIRVVVPSTPFSEEKPTERNGKWSWDSPKGNTNDKVRVRMGLLKPLSITSSEYKKLIASKEQYMEEALKLKEEKERKTTKDEDDEDDDDEDDDENVSSNPTQNAKAIVRSGEGNSTPVIVDKCDNKEAAGGTVDVYSNTCKDEGVVALNRIGKVTPYDDFCGDIPAAPELIRRCLAVLRALSMAESAEPFLYPVDPQTNPGYYDMVVRPMCFREAGKQLQKAAATNSNDSEFLEEVVVQFARNIRLIAQNCLSYANAGPTVVAAGSEMIRIFERLLLDWVLAPESLLPALHELDDEKCVEFHESDEEATQLFCDGCEGKYNIARLDPPLAEIPSGDWYCPRCINGRCFASLDPRMRRKVLATVDERGTSKASLVGGQIVKSWFAYEQGMDSRPSILYEIRAEDGHSEVWTLQQVDRALPDVQPIKWLQAVAESPGYGVGIDYGLRHDLVPVPLNPTISDASAQVAISSSVFRDTISAAAILLLIDPREMTAVEWLRLLVLLVMKCASGDVLQNVMSQMEGEAAESMLKPLEKVGQIFTIQDVLPAVKEDLIDDSDAMSDDDVNEDIAEGSGDVNVKEENIESVPTVWKSEESNHVTTSSKSISPDQSVKVETILSSEIVQSSEPGADTKSNKVQGFTGAIIEKGKRQKMIEDSFVGYVIKNQIQPTVASFDEDMVSQAVDGCLSTGDRGLQFSNLRCRHLKCHFCGLTDTALGSPLVRVPDEQEWDNIFALASRSRRTHLVADVPLEKENESRLVSVRIFVDGELASFRDKKLEALQDGGMLEFAPRSDVGFQEDLRFRYGHKFPFIVGSLSAHECCAIAAHIGRKDTMIQKFKENQIQAVEKEAGMFCGRSLEIGRDRFGRSYWRFHSLLDTLFVCDESSVQRGCKSNYSATWYHYSDHASVASVIVSLQRDPIVRDLMRTFPASQRLVQDRSWRDILLKKRFPMVSNPLEIDTVRDCKPKMDGSQEQFSGDVARMTFKVGDFVFVESLSEKLLWDARVVGVSKRRAIEPTDTASIDAYRVEYKGWGSRFSEWVKASRVFQQSEDCKTSQETRFCQRASFKCGFPPVLNHLVALDYLYAKERARGDVPLPDFTRLLHVDTKCASKKTFSMVKAMALAIEAALPVGSIDNSDVGVWSQESAAQWRIMVANAEGPDALMRCFFVLEDAIALEWMKEDVNHLRSCLPDRWKAVLEASPSSLAIRGILLDRSLKYGKVDRKKFAKKTLKKK